MNIGGVECSVEIVAVVVVTLYILDVMRRVIEKMQVVFFVRTDCDVFDHIVLVEKFDMVVGGI